MSTPCKAMFTNQFLRTRSASSRLNDPPATALMLVLGAPPRPPPLHSDQHLFRTMRCAVGRPDSCCTVPPAKYFRRFGCSTVLDLLGTHTSVFVPLKTRPHQGYTASPMPIFSDGLTSPPYKPHVSPSATSVHTPQA